jgi:hypothetical protein
LVGRILSTASTRTAVGRMGVRSDGGSRAGTTHSVPPALNLSVQENIDVGRAESAFPGRCRPAHTLSRPETRSSQPPNSRAPSSPTRSAWPTPGPAVRRAAWLVAARILFSESRIQGMADGEARSQHNSGLRTHRRTRARPTASPSSQHARRSRELETRSPRSLPAIARDAGLPPVLRRRTPRLRRQSPRMPSDQWMALAEGFAVFSPGDLSWNGRGRLSVS